MSEEAPSSFLRSVRESDKIEVVIPCVGFDDLLAICLEWAMPHVDVCHVVTSLTDGKTANVCHRFGANLIQTDTFGHGGHLFSKGAGINAAFPHFRYQGWRLLIDADILLPEHFRRVLMNHVTLDHHCLYGADRADVIGHQGYEKIPRQQWGIREEIAVPFPIRSRVITRLFGYLPLGYFQLWHAMCQREYPYTAGGAALDDAAFATLWPEPCRRLLPSVIVYHLCPSPPVLAENWDGIRRSARLEGM